MENVLVLSDIHETTKYALEVLKEHPECKTVIFLGDGARHLDELQSAFPEKGFFAVMGNCDFSSCGITEKEAVLEIGGKRIFICHGHTRMVKHGLSALLCAAKSRECEIALFGHTHIAYEGYDSESGVYMFNPGSIGDRSRGGYSYGILSIDKNNVLFSIGRI